MVTERKSRELKVTVSGPLYEWLQQEAERRSQDVSTIVQSLLEQYAEGFDLTDTRTWELCGSLTIAEPESEYLVGVDSAGSPVTNYAEHVDDVLYE